MGLNKQTATRLIKRHGQPGEILRPLPPVDDGFGMAPNPNPPTPYPCIAFISSFTVDERLINYGLKDIGALRVLVAADGLAITPATTDRLRAGDLQLGITHVTPHTHAGTLLFWELRAVDSANG